MSTSKIKIKVGSIELEFEGTEEFLKTEIPALLKVIAELPQNNVTAKPLNVPSGSNGGHSGQTLSVNSVAAKLNVKTGPDLILAACLCHAHFRGQATYSRKEMRGASTYFKKTYINNLTGSLDRLISDGKLLQNGDDAYSLSATTLDELKAHLG
jgi:hypothetical protein